MVHNLFPLCKVEENNWSKCNNNSIVHKIAKNCLIFMNMSLSSCQLLCFAVCCVVWSCVVCVCLSYIYIYTLYICNIYNALFSLLLMIMMSHSILILDSHISCIYLVQDDKRAGILKIGLTLMWKVMIGYIPCVLNAQTKPSKIKNPGACFFFVYHETGLFRSMFL